MFLRGLEVHGYANTLASLLNIESPYVGLRWEAAEVVFIKLESYIKV